MSDGKAIFVCRIYSRGYQKIRMLLIPILLDPNFKKDEKKYHHRGRRKWHPNGE